MSAKITFTATDGTEHTLSSVSDITVNWGDYSTTLERYQREFMREWRTQFMTTLEWDDPWKDRRPDGQTPSYIERALHFAQSYLGIRARDFIRAYVIDPFEAFSGSLGTFSLAYPHVMRYNGKPSLETIFHEAVHFAQWERDGAETMTLIYKTYPYNQNPYEIEAREKSAEMEREYPEWQRTRRYAEDYEYRQRVDMTAPVTLDYVKMTGA